MKTQNIEHLEGEDSVNNLCVGTEANFSVFIKTVVNYFIITAISLISIFVVLHLNNRFKKTNMSPLIKVGIVIASVSAFTSVVGGLNPIAYDSIVIGVGICLGFMLFTNIVSAADLQEMLKNALAPAPKEL